MKKVLVGLSGGVDSAVAAYLLQQQGYDVTCAFMRNWDSVANEDFSGNPTLYDPVCPQEADYKDAADVASKLGLELLRIDFIKEYWDDVFQTFKGFDTVATGHYVRLGEEGDHHVLCKAVDHNKDQSYFLTEICREVLEHVLFPLGEIEKPEVRRIAEELGLSIAKKKDSTGICFIGERHFREFLSNYLPMKSGDIIDVTTKQKVGTHQGVMYYTIGQRKGLDIGGIGPFFVVGKDVFKNELYVVDSLHQDLLYATSCLVTGVNWLADRTLPLQCHAKFRYRQADNDVELVLNEDGTLTALFPEGIRSITPGQEAVFYDGDVMFAGGKIEKVFKDGVDLMEHVKLLVHPETDK